LISCFKISENNMFFRDLCTSPFAVMFYICGDIKMIQLSVI